MPIIFKRVDADVYFAYDESEIPKNPSAFAAVYEGYVCDAQGQRLPSLTRYIIKESKTREYGSVYEGEAQTLKDLVEETKKLTRGAAYSPEPVYLVARADDSELHGLVMPLYETTLNERLRSQWGNKSKDAEEQMISLCLQYTYLLEALHQLGYACLDRKLDDLRWQPVEDMKEGGHLMVIDWNVLQPYDDSTALNELRLSGRLWYTLCVGRTYAGLPNPFNDRDWVRPDAPRTADGGVISIGLRLLLVNAMSGILHRKDSDDPIVEWRTSLEAWQRGLQTPFMRLPSSTFGDISPLQHEVLQADLAWRYYQEDKRTRDDKNEQLVQYPAELDALHEKLKEVPRIVESGEYAAAHQSLRALNATNNVQRAALARWRALLEVLEPDILPREDRAVDRGRLIMGVLRLQRARRDDALVEDYEQRQAKSVGMPSWHTSLYDMLQHYQKVGEHIKRGPHPQGANKLEFLTNEIELRIALLELDVERNPRKRQQLVQKVNAYWQALPAELAECVVPRDELAQISPTIFEEIEMYDKELADLKSSFEDSLKRAENPRDLNEWYTIFRQFYEDYVQTYKKLSQGVERERVAQFKEQVTPYLRLTHLVLNFGDYTLEQVADIAKTVTRTVPQSSTLLETLRAKKRKDLDTAQERAAAEQVTTQEIILGELEPKLVEYDTLLKAVQNRIEEQTKELQSQHGQLRRANGFMLVGSVLVGLLALGLVLGFFLARGEISRLQSTLEAFAGQTVAQVTTIPAPIDTVMTNTPAASETSAAVETEVVVVPSMTETPTVTSTPSATPTATSTPTPEPLSLRLDASMRSEVDLAAGGAFTFTVQLFKADGSLAEGLPFTFLWEIAPQPQAGNLSTTRDSAAGPLSSVTYTAPAAIIAPVREEIYVSVEGRDDIAELLLTVRVYPPLPLLAEQNLDAELGAWQRDGLLATGDSSLLTRMLALNALTPDYPLMVRCEVLTSPQDTTNMILITVNGQAVVSNQPLTLRTDSQGSLTLEVAAGGALGLLRFSVEDALNPSNRIEVIFPTGVTRSRLSNNDSNWLDVALDLNGNFFGFSPGIDNNANRYAGFGGANYYVYLLSPVSSVAHLPVLFNFWIDARYVPQPEDGTPRQSISASAATLSGTLPGSGTVRYIPAGNPAMDTDRDSVASLESQITTFGNLLDSSNPPMVFVMAEPASDITDIIFVAEYAFQDKTYLLGYALANAHCGTLPDITNFTCPLVTVTPTIDPLATPIPSITAEVESEGQ